MINPKELRMGNWLYFKTAPTGIFEFHQVVSTDPAAVKISNHPFPSVKAQENFPGCVEYRHIDPIPLTSVILEALGFKINRASFNYSESSSHEQTIITYSKGWFMLVYYSTGEFSFMGWQKFKYVHNLQNLYYELTGEELEIKGAIE
jgi:hypothetical protein